MSDDTPYSDARPGSFAAIIRVDSPDGCEIALLGLPDDTGVRLNHGRPGARDGPRAFREALSRYGTTNELEVVVFDAGDVAPRDSIEATHDAVTEKVRELLALDLLPVCIGGGHDLTWPAIRAVAEKHPDLSGVYLDAHLDVREDVGSGMAFRKILTETSCRELYVVGLDRFANSREHIDWFQSNSGRISDSFPEGLSGDVFVSFDLDVLNASIAPGVSAINPVGYDARFGDDTARSVGSMTNVRYFDIMELNPVYDIDGRTARLAARLFLSFLAGVAQRAGDQGR